MATAQKAELPPRLYEAVYILRPDLTKEISEKVAQRVAEVIAREGGTLTLVENWGRRPMSYEMQHHKRGVYVYINYLGDGVLVAELERNFRLLDEVMRFQTVKVSDAPEVGEVDAERVKFEAIEPAADDEEPEMSLEEELGLIHAPRSSHYRNRDDLDDDDAGDDDDDDIIIGSRAPASPASPASDDDDKEGADK
jgi:small subunit ribosomal protein S6